MSLLNEKGSVVLENKKAFKVNGVSGIVYIVFSAMVITMAYMGTLPGGLVGTLPFLMVVGGLIVKGGDKIPILKDYLGGGPMLALFGSSVLVHFDLIPTYVLEGIKVFFSTAQFLNFLLAALITGAILGMNRNQLVKSFTRYIPVILGGVLGAFLLTGIVGALTGYGVKEAILYIAVPIMGGGIGAGVLPLSEIFATNTGLEAGHFLGIMLPATALGNAVAIIAAALLDNYGKKHPHATGNGKLMKTLNEENEENEKKQENISFDFMDIGFGLIVSSTFFMVSAALSKFIPIHTYAILIILVILVKFIGMIPQEIAIISDNWYKFLVKTFLGSILAGMGFVYINFQDLLNAISLQYIVLVVMTIVGSVIGTMLVSRFVNFYAVEAAITGGLCMANTGGSGDIAVLSAANRMELLPYAQISSRLGGTFILILAAALLKIFI